MQRSSKKLLAVLGGAVPETPPLWLMRQAGRYLPEYRALRERAGGFLKLCYTPELACEATLQPVRRFGFDGAILFSDILVIPDALGQGVRFETGEGPRLDPLTGDADIARLDRAGMLGRLAPVFEAIGLARARLPAETTLLGFCGAPWTVASYMIAGGANPEQATARLFAYREPEAFAALIDLLVDCSIDYLVAQAEAGVEAAQIFDSWAGALARPEFERWSLAPLARIVAGARARAPGLRIIVFARGAGAALGEVATRTGADAIGLDTSVDPAFAARVVPAHVATQGNVDPLALVAGGPALAESVARIRAACAGRPHVFNLGHGITPQTPIAHVEELARLVRTP